jgi:high-affinity iron transporter
MIGTLIIVFREVIEAGIIVGIVLAATHGIAHRGRFIATGVAAGLVGACVVALFAGGLSEMFAGSGQEIFNAAVLILAVCMLAWHNAWMARHAAELVAETKAVANDVRAGSKPLTALAVVCAVAVLREGSEVVLFLYGVVAAGTTMGALLTGGLLGIAAGAVVSALSYFGLLAIPTRYIFRVTGVIIAFLAAGLAAQSVAFLNAAGIVEAFGDQLWDTSGVLSEASIAGRILHTLVGYSDRPTELQFAVYLGTLLLMFLLTRYAASARRVAAHRVKADRPSTI